MNESSSTRNKVKREKEKKIMKHPVEKKSKSKKEKVPEQRLMRYCEKEYE